MKKYREVICIFSIVIGILTIIPSVRAIYYESTKSATLNTSVRIKARTEDILFAFISDKVNMVVGAEEEIEYTITYGSLLSYGTPMTITAEWSLGTVPDQSLYSYNILSYVAGSATKDYWGESTPVVDVVHRTITWTVTRFPPNTIGKTLKFRLKTPGRYVTDRNVNFTIRARLVQEDITKDWINLDNVYSPTEFIRREVSGLQLLTADVRRITDQSFSLFIVTSVPAKTVIYYGLTPDNLDKTYADDMLSDQKLITIDGLLPSTTYYYRILIENEKGIQRKTPEVFQVTTSSTSLVALIDQDRVLISSRGVLLKNTSGLGPESTVVVPRGVPVELFLPFRSGVPTSVYLSLANQTVLGISTEGPPETSDRKVRFLETQARTYTGTITSPNLVGLYDLIIESEGDITGTNRDMLTTLIVSDPITVVANTGKPIERALVYLERMGDYSGKYEYFPAETYGARNPSYTDSDGSADIVLPDGDYMVNVNAIGYKTYQKNFYFNPSGRQPYPRVVLEPGSFNLLNYVSYYWSVTVDSFRFFNWNVDKLASSWRFLDLSLLTSVFILTILSLLTNLRRVKVTLEGLDIFIEKKFFRILRYHKPENVFIGFVERLDNGWPVHGATAILIDRKTKAITGRDITSGLGEFHLRLEPGREYELTFKKTGLEVRREIIGTPVLVYGHEPFRMTPVKTVSLHPVIEFSVVTARSIFHALSDTLLFAVGILNLLFWYRLGIRVLPTVIITAVNALLWLSYEWHLFRVGKRL